MKQCVGVSEVKIEETGDSLGPPFGYRCWTTFWIQMDVSVRGTPEMERTKMELLFPRRFKNLIRFNYEKFGRWEGGPRWRGYMCTCS